MDLMKLYDRLYGFFGPQHWWPGDSPLEIMIGAVLTQNTNWQNVEKAISNLKEARLMDLESLYNVPAQSLAEYIRPAGYYNIKSVRLKHLIVFVKENYGSIEKMFEEETEILREKLLAVKGLGPETVDSILLYAGNKPIFVVDAYTKRIFSRHNLCFEDVDYHELQSEIMASLPKDLDLYNEFHALIVRLGKDYCKKRNPLCEKCPINGF